MKMLYNRAGATPLDQLNTKKGIVAITVDPQIRFSNQSKYFPGPERNCCESKRLFESNNLSSIRSGRTRKKPFGSESSFGSIFLLNQTVSRIKEFSAQIRPDSLKFFRSEKLFSSMVMAGGGVCRILSPYIVK